MRYKIITNNACISIYSKDKEEYFDVLLLKGSVKDVVNEARDFIMNNWKLVSDPLGGRQGRANPFLTVILQQDKKDKNIAWNDILRVEQLSDIYFKNIDNFKLFNQKALDDFQTLDTSLTVSALDKLACLS